MNTDEPRQTKVPLAERPASAKFNPTRIFVDRDRLAWFWFLIAGVVLIGAAVDRFYLVRAFKQRERVVIIDPANTFYVSPLLQFQEAKALHAQQSTLAALAFLDRNPKGFDHPELLKQLFLKGVYEKASDQRFKEEAEFRAKQLHQKVEIGKIDVLNTRENYVLTQVTGQLIRNGVFEDKGFTEVLDFKLWLKLERNPNMAENGRFPTAIKEFKYEVAH